MSKKKFMEFANYLEGFTQRIVQRYRETASFIEDEKTIMVERFPELGSKASETKLRSQFELAKETHELCINEERSM